MRINVFVRTIRSCLAFFVCAYAATASAQVKPNVFIFYVDDMGMGDTSVYLQEQLSHGGVPIPVSIVTPNLERLAAQGLTFTDAHTSSPMCTPSRYALLTGRYPWRTYNKHKVIDSWASAPMIAPDRPTLATLLKKNGYRTAMIGKWHLGWSWRGKDGQPKVFTWAAEFKWDQIKVGAAPDGGMVASVVDGPKAHGFDRFFGLAGNFYFEQKSSIKAYMEGNSFVGEPTWKGAAGPDADGPGVPDWDQQRIGERYLNEVLDYIDEHVNTGRTSPFFMYYSPNANHEPHDPATEIVVQGQSYAVRGQAELSDGTPATLRDDMVYENDLAVGLLLDKLATVDDPRTGRPMIESTLFVFTSDNGADRYYGGRPSGFLRDSKGSMYEGGHRVPFIVSWPDGSVPEGALSRANFGQVDLYASLASLLGTQLQPDEAEDSANVLPALLGQVSGSEFQRSHALVMHDDRQEKNDLPDDSLLLVRDGAYTLMIDGKLINRNQNSGNDRGTPKPIKLFDLDTALYQFTNHLYRPAQADRIAAGAERLLRFHNQGFSRPLGLGGGQILHTDGGTNLRNDRSGAIGYEFTVGSAPVTLESLGLWDDAADDLVDQETEASSDGQTVGVPDGLSTDHVVRLFDAGTQQELAAVAVTNANSYLLGEFRYVDLAQPVALQAGATYALTMDTAAEDGDMFHHFAAFTAVSPAPSDLVSDFVARRSATDGEYPALYPDGPDGAAERHPDMFRHRMFVGPNARITADPMFVDPSGEPDYIPASDRGVFLWRDADQSWKLRATGGGAFTNYIGSMTSDNGLAYVLPFSFESEDLLDVSANDALFSLSMSGVWEDGLDFAVPEGSRVCVDLSAPQDTMVLVGAAKTPVLPPFSLNDFGACESESSCHQQP